MTRERKRKPTALDVTMADLRKRADEALAEVTSLRLKANVIEAEAFGKLDAVHAMEIAANNMRARRREKKAAVAAA